MYVTAIFTHYRDRVDNTVTPFLLVSTPTDAHSVALTFPGYMRMRNDRVAFNTVVNALLAGMVR